VKKPNNCVLVIFGASGDLTKRRLVPGLFNLYQRDLLPDGFAVLGAGRTKLDDAAFRAKMIDGLKTFGRGSGPEKSIAPAEDQASQPSKALDAFIDGLYYQSVDTKDPDDYRLIKEKLKQIDGKKNTDGNYLFYLSTPPSLFEPVASGLGKHGLHVQGNGFRRLVVEKPFGYDLESAHGLNDALHRVFDETQIFRIDHYLGKETVQNMLVFRFANGIFEPLWNRNYIDRVEVTAAEQLGVEGRGGYYEGSGALRDMFQNHLLNVVGMIAMEPPSHFNADSVRNETIKVFEALRQIREDDVERYVVRGQYTESRVRGENIAAYRSEPGVAADSKTNTYVAVKLFVDNWRWGGVPFYVRTGKRLPTRVTEAVIHFKQIPHRLFGRLSDACYGCNQLVIRIQPDEGILMTFNMKLPGSGFEIKKVSMDFRYSELSDVYTPEAYERLLLDSMIGDATLHARSDAVEACWEFVDPILKAWESNPETKLYGYPAGTWGPREAQALFDDPALDWRYPCRNLAEDGEFCEL
jgi:glucose-6-phosphate 1-dehydrogenase